MRSSPPLLALLFVVSLSACGDDATGAASGGSGGGGSGGGATSGASTTSTTSTSSSSASSASSTSTGDQGGGGAGQGGAGGSGGDAPGGGGGAGVCPEMPVGDTVEAACELEGPLAMPVEDQAACAELDPTWPVQVFEIEVEEGACVHVRVDNAGSEGAGTFAFIVDPVGDNVWVDELADCAVDVPEGFLCAEGSLTMGAAGTAFVWAGAYAGEGCAPGAEAPIQLAASVDGVDVDLSAGPVCRGDLLELVP